MSNLDKGKSESEKDPKQAQMSDARKSRWNELKNKFLSGLPRFPLEIANINNMAGDIISLKCDRFSDLRVSRVKQLYEEQYGCPISLTSIIDNSQNDASSTTDANEDVGTMNNPVPDALLLAETDSWEFLPSSPPRKLDSKKKCAVG